MTDTFWLSLALVGSVVGGLGAGWLLLRRLAARLKAIEGTQEQDAKAAADPPSLHWLATRNAELEKALEAEKATTAAARDAQWHEMNRRFARQAAYNRRLEAYNRQMAEWGGMMITLYRATQDQARTAMRLLAAQPNGADLLKQLPGMPAGDAPAVPVPPWLDSDLPTEDPP